MSGWEVSERSPFLSVGSSQAHRLRSFPRACVICVGSTGAGKSSTISLATGNAVALSDSSGSVTKHCQLYENLLEPGTAAWLDTVGWEDRTKDDKETFREILAYIHQHDMAQLLAVVWCVCPSVRTDASLRRQAEFIDKLKAGEIWKNVIIVVKQSVNPKYDARGALAAAADFADNDLQPVKVVGYRFLNDLAFSEEQKEVMSKHRDLREVMNVLSDGEIRDVLWSKLAMIPGPVQVIFSDSVCQDCGEKGDARLMSEFCHMEKEIIHPAPPRPSHPSNSARFHPTDRLCKIHPGDVTVGRCGRLCGCGPCTKPRYSCCGRKETTEGCRQVLVCCRNHPTATGCQSKYPCCGMVVGPGEGKGCTSTHPCCGAAQGQGPGCKEVCRKCQQPWGSTALQCFRKEHNTGEGRAR